MDSLRKRLQAMTEVEDVSQHPRLLQEIRGKCPNTIELLASPHPVGRYTCLVHVLGFAGCPDYEAIASRGFHVVFAGRAFAHWLIDRGALSEVSQPEAKTGDFVFYFDQDGRFMHAGLDRTNLRVTSKWGIGHLYEHELWDVPESYGTSVRFFKQLPYEEALDLFIQFAREKGMFF